jgi:hypothetical protein
MDYGLRGAAAGALTLLITCAVAFGFAKMVSFYES